VRGEDAIRSWGDEAGRRYVQRIGLLLAADRLVGLFELRALDLHPLRGDRAGQCAIRLTGQMRLIISVPDPRRVIVE
jgi:toxin HigB-1